MILHFTMKSESSGRGQVFWKEAGQPFAAERSTRFDVHHDGHEHTYAVTMSAGAPVLGCANRSISSSRADGIVRHAAHQSEG